MTLISYWDLVSRCRSLHLEWTYLHIMFSLSVKFASSVYKFVYKSLISDP